MRRFFSDLLLDPWMLIVAVAVFFALWSRST
jgi:hypothetical protein